MGKAGKTRPRSRRGANGSHFVYGQVVHQHADLLYCNAVRSVQFSTPIEVHIFSGSGAIAVEAHAVQLALQAGFGLALGAVP